MRLSILALGLAMMGVTQMAPHAAPAVSAAAAPATPRLVVSPDLLKGVYVARVENAPDARLEVDVECFQSDKLVSWARHPVKLANARFMVGASDHWEAAEGRCTASLVEAREDDADASAPLAVSSFVVPTDD